MNDFDPTPENNEELVLSCRDFLLQYRNDEGDEDGNFATALKTVESWVHGHTYTHYLGNEMRENWVKHGSMMKRVSITKDEH